MFYYYWYFVFAKTFHLQFLISVFLFIIRSDHAVHAVYNLYYITMTKISQIIIKKSGTDKSAINSQGDIDTSQIIATIMNSTTFMGKMFVNFYRIGWVLRIGLCVTLSLINSLACDNVSTTLFIYTSVQFLIMSAACQ